MRGHICDDNEPFFKFVDGSPVKPQMARNTLHMLLNSIRINGALSDFHSFRSGRSLDLLKYGFSIEEIKQLRRWKSNAVYKYLRPFYI